jgi:hypothetical protein
MVALPRDWVKTLVRVYMTRGWLTIGELQWSQNEIHYARKENSQRMTKFTRIATNSVTPMRTGPMTWSRVAVNQQSSKNQLPSPKLPGSRLRIIDTRS